MDVFADLGVLPYINAHDTYTIYGGSRMSDETLAAMAAASRHFVDIEQTQRAMGEKIAQMTHNEGAYLTNGCAGGLLLTAAVCMAGGSLADYMRLPDTARLQKNEIILMRGQRNAYDAAVRASGAAIVEIGDADETPAYELEGALNSRTAAVFYFVSTNFARASLPLEDTIHIAHAAGVPVVVDAAAQLPPPENLWRFTKMGADLVLFSGGKTLRGPQDSGLILGRRALIEDCVRFGAPVHGICRSSKTSREAMAGLYAALCQYLALDQAAETARLEAINARLGACMKAHGLRVEAVPFGPVGQTYPRVFGYCPWLGMARAVSDAMRQRRIYIGVDAQANAIYISPLNLQEAEVQTVERALGEVLAGILE